MAKNSEAKIKANYRYDTKTYFKINVRFRREQEQLLKKHLNGSSYNSFIVGAVMEKIERLENGTDKGCVK